MMLSVLVLTCIGSIGAELQAEWRVPIPVEMSRPYGSIRLSRSAQQAVWPFILDDRHAVGWADSKTGRTRTLDRAAQVIEQVDCGLGLVSAQKDESVLTWDIGNGRLLSKIPRRGTRVGNLLLVVDSKEDVYEFWDVRTGRLARRTDMGYGRSKDSDPYSGVPAWDTPRKRLFIVGQGNKPNDVKDVVEMAPGGWVEGRRSPLSSYAMGFAGVVGDPEKGCFAILEQTNRATHPTGLYTRDMVRLDVKVDLVVDAGQFGFLAVNGTWDELQNLEPNELVCITPAGVAAWHAPPAEARWIGKYAMVGTELLDGKTGKRAATVKLPDGIEKFAWLGDRAVAIQRGADPTMICFRLVVPD